eukprot:3674008-Amphidinium_carterae.1
MYNLEDQQILPECLSVTSSSSEAVGTEILTDDCEVVEDNVLTAPTIVEDSEVIAAITVHAEVTSCDTKRR